MGSDNVVHKLRATDRDAPDSPTASREWAHSLDESVKSALGRRDDASLVRYEKRDNAAWLCRARLLTRGRS